MGLHRMNYTSIIHIYEGVPCRQVCKSGVWDARVKRFARACTHILFNLGIIYVAVKCCTHICEDANYQSCNISAAYKYSVQQ